MFNILLLKLINLSFLCLSMAELNATATISIDYIKNSSTNNQINGNNKYSYEITMNMAANKDEVKTNFNTKKVYRPIFASGSSQDIDNIPTTTTLANMAWDSEEKFLQNIYLKIKREIEKNQCLLDSFKWALLWWSHPNGTLRDTNYQIWKPQEQLDLSYQNIGSDKKTFKLINENFQNISLVALSLAYNNFTRVPYQTLNMMAHSLKYLTLRGNSFTNEKVNVTTNAKHNIYIFASRNRYELAWARFPNMSLLIELDISHCNIEHIEKSVFRNLINLKNLYMSHNRILILPANTFLYAPSLQVLDISFANVYDSLINRSIAATNFELLMQIFNGVNIEQKFFKYLPKLIYLDLSHTKLRRSSAMAFTQVGPSLKYLSLCFTLFPLFGNGIFKNTSLIGLDLSGNSAASFNLDEQVFASLSESLQYLIFEKANLHNLNWLKPLKNLRFLDVAHNNINILQETDFMSLNKLQMLDLSSNQVINWYSRVFQHNENLRILSLRANNINILTSEMLKDFSTVYYLSLGYNNFLCDCVLHDLLDVSSLNNLQAQCTRNISTIIKFNNTLSTVYFPDILQDSYLFFQSGFRTLDVSYLLASQHHNKFRQHIKLLAQSPEFKSTASRIQFKITSLKNARTCQPQLLHNSSEFLSRKLNISVFKLQLLDYADDQYWCYNETRKVNLRGLNCKRARLIDNLEEELNTLTTYILSSVASFFFIAILGIVIYKKRWHIYYYYSSLKTAALLSVVSKEKLNDFNNLCEQNPSMIYDIFISYCQCDRNWIVEELLPNVEKAGDVTICLHERDFQIGVTILDNIVSCMERSKALMLIISSNFLLSHWCQFEMQLAHYHILDLNKNNLILVFLEDIPRSKRPKNLQFLMNVKTYIKWPGGKCPEERKLFWKRLQRTLKYMGLNPLESRA